MVKRLTIKQKRTVKLSNHTTSITFFNGTDSDAYRNRSFLCLDSFRKHCCFSIFELEVKSAVTSNVSYSPAPANGFGGASNRSPKWIPFPWAQSKAFISKEKHFTKWIFDLWDCDYSPPSKIFAVPTGVSSICSLR